MTDEDFFKFAGLIPAEIFALKEEYLKRSREPISVEAIHRAFLPEEERHFKDDFDAWRRYQVEMMMRGAGHPEMKWTDMDHFLAGRRTMREEFLKQP